MASVIEDPPGLWRIEFMGRGKRERIRLGRVSGKRAQAVGRKVESLLTAVAVGQRPDKEALIWLEGCGGKLRDRLVGLGLADPAANLIHTLGDLLREFMAHLCIKSSTRTTYEQTVRSLLEGFTSARLVSQITTFDADKWRSSLMASGLARATVSKRVKTARQIFKLAARWKWINENPFADVLAGSQVNRDRMQFVTCDDTQRVMDMCPDPQLRLVVALARYGGLRCPSEVVGLEWSDVKWDEDKFFVHAPKTERHSHGGDRFVPIFPELLPYLREAFEGANAGAVKVCPGVRPGSNLATQLHRIIKRAGVAPWPRTFNNLRSSRIMELVREFPLHVVTAWVGNSPEVARLHYLHETGADFAKAAQKAAQHSPETCGTARYTSPAFEAKSMDLPGDAALCRSVPMASMTPTGSFSHSPRQRPG